MSNQNAMPSKESAFDAVFGNVYQQVFFHKLASHGIQPEDGVQHAAMLEGAMRLRQFEDNEATKQASASADPYVAINNYLGQMSGENATVKAAQEEQSVNELASHFMQDPDLYNSVISLKVHDAETLANRGY